MDKWEYWTTILVANIEVADVREALQYMFPNSTPRKFGVECLMPQLDEMGANGWELVHMEPIHGMGTSGDIFHDSSGTGYSNLYFCVLKRKSE